MGVCKMIRIYVNKYEQGNIGDVEYSISFDSIKTKSFALLLLDEIADRMKKKLLDAIHSDNFEIAFEVTDELKRVNDAREKLKEL